MNRHLMRTALSGTAAIAATGLAISLTSAPASADTIEITLEDAVAELPVASEEPDGYDRDLFPHWTDDDGDGCNTRYEVLIDEAVEAPDVDEDCNLTGGRWYSYFDGEYRDDHADIDIDHFVPLAEAWRSGARDWSTEDRQRFANDLDDDRSLAAVTSESNRSKGDSDPPNWMPDEERCRYITEWTAVKTRWGLNVDNSEKGYLTALAEDCPNVTLTIEYAR